MKKLTPVFILSFVIATFPTLKATPELPVVQYIEAYKEIAISEMKRTGIPASITLAQAIVESKYGTSTLAIQSNNHFGIKCKDNWNGKTFYFKDDDYQNGQLIESCFRGYDDPVQSYYDHSDFLLENIRYQPLFQLNKTDYRNWAKGLKKCGYATAPNYANKLIATIEKYQLYQFDRMTTLIQAVFVSKPVNRQEVALLASEQLPPQPFKLPTNYKRRQSIAYTAEPLSYEEAVFNGTNTYLFEVVSPIERDSKD